MSGCTISSFSRRAQLHEYEYNIKQDMVRDWLRVCRVVLTLFPCNHIVYVVYIVYCII
jgi:hypothetical protein